MDNLIAEGKAKPFIIVMDNSGIGGRARRTRHGRSRTGAPPQASRIRHVAQRQARVAAAARRLSTSPPPSGDPDRD